MRTTLLMLCLLLLAGTVGLADESGWPREADHPRAKIVMYQPQVEKLTGDDLEARAAVSVTPEGTTEPRFGAVWIKTRVEVDRDQRTVTFTDIQVSKVRFPDATEGQEKELIRFLEYEMPQWELVDAYDRLVAALDTTEVVASGDPGLSNSPPRIVVSTEPAVLVLIDGEPKLLPVDEPKKAKKKKIEKVLNTPFLIVRYPKTEQFFLYGGGELWYEATAALGPWSPSAKVPKAVKAMVEEEDEDGAADEEAGRIPAIVVSTEATELIVFDGKPDYAAVGDSDLLYVTNTNNDVFMEKKLQKHFILLSGRWFTSVSLLDGSWAFVAPGDLPEAFSQIPPDSEVAHVLPHVAGTPQAREAVLDSTIPQTAAIRRDDASLKVEYDGQPQFEPVEGMNVTYAVNSPQAVFKVGSRYYCCEQAAWYESGAPTGPWQVCVEVPEAIYGIPASNPHHNVTYVYVYETTPDVVYVGYLPGYVGGYVYGGSVVYGTGWHYPGWYGSVYYPYPSTWGFHASYNPWGGWGYGVSYTNGAFTFSFSAYGHGYGYYPYGGWWGPCGYNPYYRPGYRYPPGDYPGYRPGYRPGYGPGYPGGARPPAGSTRPSGGGSAVPRPATGAAGAQARPAAGASQAGARSGQNLYSRDSNAARNASLPSSTTRARPSNVASQPNNVYADRNGNVHRRTSDGWQQRQGGGWTPSSGSPSARPSSSSLSRDYWARSQGQARTQQYRSAPRTSAPRGGGARRR